MAKLHLSAIAGIAGIGAVLVGAYASTFAHPNIKSWKVQVYDHGAIEFAPDVIINYECPGDWAPVKDIDMKRVEDGTVRVNWGGLGRRKGNSEFHCLSPISTVGGSSR